MSFHHYTEIEPTYRETFVDKIKRISGDIKYCITEKVHGSNTQIYYDGENFRIGSRNNFVDDHYGFKKIADSLRPNIEKLFQYIKTENKYVEYIALYGEIFGGFYPNIPKEENSKRIQKGVWYHNGNRWLAFDIRLSTNEYLTAEKFFQLCGEFDIPRVPILSVVGSFEEALNYPNDGESVVHRIYNLPKVENNIMEGVVIKPWSVNLRVGDGDRVILKNKNSHFKEVARKTKEVVLLPENLQEIVDVLKDYVTENRLDNVLSHLEQVTCKDIGIVIKEMTFDVLKDFGKDHSVFETLEKADVKKITKELNGMISKIVKKRLIGIS